MSNKDKKYYETHKEQIKLYKKQYYEKYKEQIGQHVKQYRETHKNEIKQYYKINKQKIIKQVKNNYESNLSHCIYMFELSDNKIYIGSTNNLYQRQIIHKADCKRYPNRKLYKAVIDNGGWDQVKVHILIDNIPYEDLRLKLEQHFINMIPEELCLNKHIHFTM